MKVKSLLHRGVDSMPGVEQLLYMCKYTAPRVSVKV